MENPEESFLLDIRDFFDYYDPGDPYMLAAISELQSELPEYILNPNASWFQTWRLAGKRHLCRGQTGS